VDTREARLAVIKLLPSLTTGRVLITSRRRDWPAGVRRRAIDRVLLQPAAEFLLQRTGEDRKREADDTEQALRLAELLDGLPLALEQAGAYIVHTQISFAQYRKIWERESDAVLGWHDEGVMQYPASLAITWQRSFHQLTPTARAILRLASFLAPDPIPPEIFESGQEVVVQAAALLSRETGEPELGRTIRAALAELRSLSLISISEPGNLFTLHRLMQEVVRNRTPEDLRLVWLSLSVELLGRYSHLATDDSSNWPLWDLLRPHVVQTLTSCVQQGVESDSAARLMTNLGALLIAKGLYAEAEPWLLRVLETDESAFGAEHPEVAGDLTNLAWLFKATGKYEEAELLMRRALKISRTCGIDCLELTKQLNGLALILMELAKWPEAEELLREALALDDETHEISLARDLHNLALLLASIGRSPEAESLILRSLELSRKVHGASHPKTARKMQILAGILRDLGRPDEAEPLVREALEIFEGILGPDHPQTQSARHDLDTLTAA
jgi:tetratricopeptide (TPR) repeat protein